MSKELEILKKENKIFRLLLDDAPTGIGVSDLQGNVFYMNKKMTDLTGYSLREFKKVNLKNTYVDPEERLKLIKELKKKGRVCNWEVRLKRKDNSIYHALLNIGIADFDGQNLLFTCGYDNTKLRKTQDDLRIKNNVLESSINAIALADSKANLIYINPAFIKMWRYDKKEEIVGRSGVEFWQIRKEAKKVLKALYKENGWIGELKAKRKDNTFFDTQVSASIVRDDKGNPLCLMASFVDITERRRIEKIKNEFLSFASHQLRTPLATMRWYSELLLSKETGNINEQQRKFLRQIYNSNQELINLINAILNSSRIELNSFIIEPKSIRITEFVQSIIKDFSFQTRKKKIKIRKSFNSNLSTIRVDPELMKIILDNLISNAVKYTPQGGRISIGLRNKGKNMIIRVSDNGFGIPKSQSDKIFGKLFRADNIKEKEPNGNGLGLYITKSIIEQVGGRIWFKSEANKGSSFYVAIPLKGMKKRKGTKRLT